MAAQASFACAADEVINSSTMVQSMNVTERIAIDSFSVFIATSCQSRSRIVA